MRRVASFLGVVVILVLVLVLFWQVYLHHEAMDPSRIDETVVAHVKIARVFA